MILRRYTTLNHLAQSGRSLLNNSLQINQMFEDINKIDFHQIQVCFFFFFIIFQSNYF